MNPLKLATLLAMLAVTVICAPLEGTISLFHQKLGPNLDIGSNLVVEPPTGRRYAPQFFMFWNDQSKQLLPVQADLRCLFLHLPFHRGSSANADALCHSISPFSYEK
ncbi:hypothetical protein C8J57DRAFT_1332628 [Mycena rebaudengoi]|nr:hypothetical protein C8J57DRAFT_1332628 [Mycena rebaudengoi]